MLETRRDHPADLHEGCSTRRSCSTRDGCTDRIREPYFFGYVRDKLIEAYGAATVRSGGLKVYTTIMPRYQRLAETAIKETLNLPTDPALGAHLDQPENRRDPGDGGGRPQSPEEPVQPALAGTPSARVDVQDVRAHGGSRAGHQPGLDVLRLGAVHVQDAPCRQLRRRQLVVRPHLRQRLLRLELDPQRDAPVGQLRVRAAHPRRRSGEGRRGGAADGRPLAARRERRVRAVDRSRLDRGVTARSRVRVLDARSGGCARRADGDPPRRSPGRRCRHATRAGASRSGGGRSPRAPRRS